ncbi:DUF423 domain-containing protein [Bremerella sp. JC817]|uniref:DUF423 domain-containing protein n=1 Tax=Bremerella sp. JC817 TaxID=3231756 RepID=UPI00345AF7DE
MFQFNLILGAFFGIVLVVGGPIAEPYAAQKFATDLKAKAVDMPGDIGPDGRPGMPVKVISEVDRQESAQRWGKYQDGLRYLAIHAVALTVLGLVSGGRWGQVLGGIGFSLGTLFYGCGIAFSALLNMPTLAVFAPMGAIFLLMGWIGLMLAAFQVRRTPTAVA